MPDKQTATFSNGMNLECLFSRAFLHFYLSTQLVSYGTTKFIQESTQPILNFIISSTDGTQ